MAAAATGVQIGLAFGLFMGREWWAPIVSGLIAMVNVFIAMAVAIGTVQGLLQNWAAIVTAIAAAGLIAAATTALTQQIIGQGGGGGSSQVNIENQYNYDTTGRGLEGDLGNQTGG